MKLKLKVVPGSSKTMLSGWMGEVYKIKVSEPPEQGKANKAVLELLSRSLKISKSQLQIISGESSALKTVEITGLSETEIANLLK